MNLEDKPLVDLIDLMAMYKKRSDKNVGFTDFLIQAGKRYCKQYNAEMWGLYWDKENQYFRVQYELPKA